MGVLDAGRLNRRITIRRKVVSRDSFGAEVPAFKDLATVPAEVKVQPGREVFTGAQYQARSPTTFIIRWSMTTKEVNAECLVVYDGNEYEILAVRPVGDREGIALDCVTKAELPIRNL